MKPHSRAIQQSIVLRYRSDGHVRFSLPEYLCAEEVVAVLEEALLSLDGVYRAKVYKGYRKFSVWFQASVCSLKEIALKMEAALEQMIRDGLLTGGESPGPGAQLSLARPATISRWVKRKVQGIRDKAAELKMKAVLVSKVVDVQMKASSAFPRLSEKTVIGFLNDIVTFYLIKVHWDLITKRWLKEPFKHKYEWLTVFYLVFLLVRERKSNAGKPK